MVGCRYLPGRCETARAWQCTYTSAPSANDFLISRLISNSKKQETGDGTLNPGLRMMAGAVAGIIAMSSTYHLDMVRGRLTVQEGRSEQYRGILHAYQEIISKVRTYITHVAG
jgi:hypothetical protein